MWQDRKRGLVDKDSQVPPRRLCAAIAWIAALGVLVACPGPSGADPDPADDDTIADDDTGEGDDDSAGDDDILRDPDCPPDEPLRAIDLAIGDEAILIGFAITEMRLLGEHLAFGLYEVAPDCPLWEGDHPSSEAGMISWTGGCETADGTSYQGSLGQVWWREEVTSERTDLRTESTSLGWTVRSEGEDFDDLAFSGTWSACETLADVPGRCDAADGFFKLSGSKRGYLDGSIFPFGLRGHYEWSGSWTVDGVLEHAFAADVVVACRGPLRAAIVVQQSGGCPGSVPDAGSIRLEARGHVFEVDFASVHDCSNCWPWTLDGVPQEERVCSHGFGN